MPQPNGGSGRRYRLSLGRLAYEAAHHRFDVGPRDDIRARGRDDDPPSTEDSRASGAVAEQGYTEWGPLVGVSHAEMALHLRDRLAIPGIDYPRYTSEGYRGLCVHVEVATGSGRLLVLEFPFEERDHRSMPHHQRPKPTDRELTTHIMGTIGAGWEPNSRGKPFVYAIGQGSGR